MLAKTHSYNINVLQRHYSLLSDHSLSLWQDGRKQRNVISIRGLHGTALSTPQHTQRTPLRHRAGDSAPSPQTPLSQLHSCHLSLSTDQKEVKPLGQMHPLRPPPDGK